MNQDLHRWRFGIGAERLSVNETLDHEPVLVVTPENSEELQVQSQAHQVFPPYRAEGSVAEADGIQKARGEAWFGPQKALDAVLALVHETGMLI